MPYDQRYVVREAIRRDHGEPERRVAREYVRRESYEDQDTREPREIRDARDTREYRPVRESRDSRDYREVREPREVRAYREPASSPPPQRRPLRDVAPRREERTVHEPRKEESTSEESAAPAWFAVSRATGFFLGSMTLVSVIGETRFPHVSAAAWWIDLSPLPKSAARGSLALAAVLLIAFALFPRVSSLARKLGAFCTCGLLGATLWTAYKFYHAHNGQSPAELPVPFALHVAGGLLVVLPGMMTGWWERSSLFKDFLVGMSTLAVCAACFPLAQFFCLGRVNDRAPADTVAAVVAGKSESDKPADGKAATGPLHTACRLYRDGQVKKILLVPKNDRSGTPEEIAQSLKRTALAEGVAEADVLSAPVTTDGQTPFAESAKLLADQKLSQVLVVAPFYEVPRIKLCLERAGLDVHAVPLRDERSAKVNPALVREAVAFWQCYVQSLM